MSDVNWGLARTPNIYGALSDGFEQGQQMQRQKAQDAIQQERLTNDRADRQTALDDRARQTQGRTEAADALGKGDYKAAAQAAIKADDPQLLSHLRSLGDQERAQLKQRNEAQGAALASLRGPDGQLLPDAAQRWQGIKQQFLASGWHPEELNFDPMQPGVIDAEISQAMTLEQSLRLAEDRRHHIEMEKTPKVVAGGSALVRPGDDGQPEVVYRQPKTFAPQRPRASGGGGSDNSGALQAIEAELRRRGKIP